jgi:predicted 2-oxoglutarate/Fe(II)-dependent dioxygenase YbiX
MANPTNSDLLLGDRAPSCIGITAKGSLYAFEEQAGRAVVVILAQTLEDSGLLPLLSAFSARAEEFSSREVDLVALTGEDVERVFEYNFHHPSRVVLVGSLNNFLRRINFDSPAAEVMVLDRNLRVARRIGTGAPEAMVAEAAMVAKGLPSEVPHDICAPAPVLLLPNVLERELCQDLIDMHRAGPTFESPVLTTDALGRAHNKIDHTYKKRHDLLLDRDHPMHVRLAGIIQKRCFAEIKRSFQSTVTHTDRFLIACYPGDGGHFRRHRDNRPDIVAFRRFAISINLTLDANGYEGGHLRLPEFNSNPYRCPTGGAIIFSVNLLHEITPVLRGDRYTLVTHLHDDEGEAQWRAYRSSMSTVGTAD